MLADQLNNYDTRSEAFARVLRDMRARDCLKTLKGWRDEVMAPAGEGDKHRLLFDSREPVVFGESELCKSTTLCH